jgi:general stress protein YciG
MVGASAAMHFPQSFFRSTQMASNNQGSQGKSNRGFASMDPERQRQIASEGGKAAHEKGTAHEFTSEEAREAGRKGGMARSATRKKASQ